MKHYYVSVMQNATTKDYRLARGPYPTHEQALEVVEETRKKAYELDSKSWFYLFGTLSIETDTPQDGILNRYFYRDSPNGDATRSQ